jgi:hypothetical protein
MKRTKNEIKTKRKSFSNLSLFLWWPVPNLKYQYTGLNNNNSIPKHTKIFSHLVTGLSIHAPRTDGPWVGRKMTYDTIHIEWATACQVAIQYQPAGLKFSTHCSYETWSEIKFLDYGWYKDFLTNFRFSVPSSWCISALRDTKNKNSTLHFELIRCLYLYSIYVLIKDFFVRD